MHIARFAEKIAKKQRDTYEGSRFRLGAVYSVGSTIVAWGMNEPRPYGNPPTSVHAEVATLRQVKFKPKGGDLYVARVLADGSLSMSRPCDNCLKVIREHQIETIHYTNEQGIWVSEELVYED